MEPHKKEQRTTKKFLSSVDEYRKKEPESSFHFHEPHADREWTLTSVLQEKSETRKLTKAQFSEFEETKSHCMAREKTTKKRKHTHRCMPCLFKEEVLQKLLLQTYSKRCMFLC